ncbi:MAG: hypothetical protein K0S57_2673 [Ramlibacter sp.]|jgi:hypothetical protein|nr:hypothetical protein [Ramlibacter sp.]
MRHPLRLTALTSSSLGEAAHVEELLRVFMARGARLTPTRYGHYQPLKEKFSPDSLGALASEIGHGIVLWKSPKSVVQLGSYVTDYKHGSMSAGFTADAFTRDELRAFVCDVAAVLQPVLAMVHLLNEHDHASDVDKGVRVNAADAPAFGVYAKDLASGLPDFYWGMVFGQPYCELFGIERLLATPAHTVKRLGEALVYVQLTADVNDCEHNHAAVLKARQLAKRHLGLEAFFPDEHDGLLAKARQLPLIGKLMGRATVAPALVP